MIPGGLGIPRRPGRYAPHVVIVIVLVLAVIGPPGQVEAALMRSPRSSRSWDSAENWREWCPAP